ncbi:MAG: FAD-binding oxidoreductase [Gemmatimonadaceae bacterium]
MTDRSVEAGFTGELLGPNDLGYDAARRLWNAMADKRPAVIARCRSTTDVAAALAHARNEGLEVAVRGGGHSVAGLSSTDGGMMIDLQPMNRVVVDPESRRARVQGGTLLRDLDHTTHAYGLATTGGMVHHTGVAGLTLGGGFGWLARVHGLACDNLVSAEVVTADGEVVRASATENDDLFWGLRGGGGNFGIVTEFEFQLHPIGPVLSVQQRYSARHARKVVGVFTEFMDAAPPELCALVGIGPGRGSGTLDSDGESSREVYVWYTYVGQDLDVGRRLGASLQGVARTVVEQVDVMRYPDVQAATGDASGPGRRHYWKGSLMWDLSDAFLDAFVERGLLPGGGCGIEMFSLGGAIADVGEDETAYSNRGATFDLLAAATWTDPADDKRNISLTRENWSALTPFARGAVYVNDLGADTDERVRDAYGSNKFTRLAALKERWDPNNAFRLNANIAPSGSGAPTRQAQDA